MFGIDVLLKPYRRQLQWGGIWTDVTNIDTIVEIMFI